MSNTSDQVSRSVMTRIDAGKIAYKTNDVVFRFASWFLTVGAMKTAAQVTNSRILTVGAFILGLMLWLPFGYFIIGPDLKGNTTKPGLNRMIIKCLLVAIITVGVNWRISLIVDALVATHFK